MLSIENRPPEVTSAIKATFERFKPKTPKAQWLWRGQKEAYYLFRHQDEYPFIKRMILNKHQNQNQTSFIFCDLGAGEFGFSKYNCEKLNNDDEIPKGIHIDFISVRAEVHPDSNFFRRMTHEAVEDNKTTQHLLYEFPLENLIKAYQSAQNKHVLLPDIKGKIDFLIARKTMLHLVDPCGTLVQAYELLSPNKGVFMFQGFQCQMAYEKKLDKRMLNESDALKSYKNLYYALIAAQAKFCIHPSDNGDMSQAFALEKEGEHSLQLPLTYDGLVANAPNPRVQYVTTLGHWKHLQFYRNCRELEFDQLNSYALVGDTKLAHEIKQTWGKSLQDSYEVKSFSEVLSFEDVPEAWLTPSNKPNNVIYYSGLAAITLILLGIQYHHPLTYETILGLTLAVGLTAGFATACSKSLDCIMKALSNEQPTQPSIRLS